MPIIRSYGNAFEVVDYTQELNVIPLAPTLLGDVGLFEEEFLSTHTVTFEEINKSLALITDVPRGSKPLANQDYTRKVRTYPLAHFGVVDEILPQDIQGKRAYGSNDAAETKAAAMARKLERIMRNFSTTLEASRWSTLTTGNLYSPGGTISGNLFTDFGVTQQSITFDLSTATTDVVTKVEQVIAFMQDNANTGDVISGVIGYCSSEFFSAFINHPKIVAAYQYFSATDGQQINRNRAGASTGLYRTFQYGGITLQEVRTVLAGQRLIPANEAVFLPLGTNDVFKTFYGPASKIDLANTIAEKVYAWEYNDLKGDKFEIEASSDFVNIVKRPQLIVKGVKG